MKLLAFVLLGFLAHSCSGHVLIDQSAFSDHVCSEIRKDFAENEGTSLLGLTGILTSITNLANLDITILHQTNDLYGLEISGFVDFSSTGITGLRIDAHVLGQLSLTVTNDCLDILLVESSLQINLNVLNKAYFIGLGGGIGGLDVLDGFTSSAELLLRGIIKEVIKTGLLSCNTGFQGITKIVDYLGNSLSYHVNSIESSANALWLSLDLVIEEALGAATRTITLATYTVTELVEGVLCSIFVSAEIFEALLDYALDDVIPSIQRIIKATEWQLYGLYQNVDGDVSVSVLKIKTPSCKITSAGGLFSLAILLQFRDHTGNQFLELAVEAEISFGVTGKTGLLGLSFSGTSITSQQISSQSDGCGCPDVNPLDILGDLSGEIIGDLVSTVNSVFAIPSLSSLVSYLPVQPASPCTPLDAELFECDSGY